MAQRLLARFEVEATLVALLPVHVGNRDSELTQDAPLACNGRGEPYIPGTSLAGPIRAWWRDAFGDKADLEFGRIEARDKGRDPASLGYASLISVADAPAHLPAGLTTELRDGVGIDRQSGAAATSIKYDRQVLPAGTTFALKLRFDVVEGLATADIARQRLAALVAALQAGDIAFGAAKTRGLGRMQAKGVKVFERQLATRAGMLARLRGNSNAATIPDAQLTEWAAAAGANARDGRVDIVVSWQATRPVFNKSGSIGLVIDGLPLLGGGFDASQPTALTPVLTGASIKGALRAHAERICRTVAGRACDLESARSSFLTSIEMDLVSELFGSVGKSGKTPKAGDCDDRPDDAKARAAHGLGALAVEDCVVGPAVAPGEWKRIVEARAADVDQAVIAAQAQVDAATSWKDSNARDGLKRGSARIANHVAIDRWTGGAADALLFNQLEPPAPHRRQFRLRLDLARLGDACGIGLAEAERQKAAKCKPFDQAKVDAAELARDRAIQKRNAAVALLMFALRDLALGHIAFGFGSTRGFGSIKVDSIAFENPGATAEEYGFTADKALPVERLDDRTAFASFTEAEKGWVGYWTAWRANDTEKAKA